ncbi:hypothetical protein E0L93_06590 [Rubrobacter taiwanensis]|jgi:hypothetical protein|uniref:Uncharacterized protein n=1 Tax=Rubrobacter taiwanensis TaxID=185139 RepID=A0A4R1BKZ1_9ACTN|nr:Ig-like domain-containing protein [Rubrobacter taiwanensis]TCJ18081.1 hypothetical protein E0L93_06590 [Rubrobacter taiwanensis]
MNSRTRCPRCRRTVPGEAVYCDRCGALLEENVPPGRRRLRPWVYVAAAAALLALLGSSIAGMYALFGEEPGSIPPAPPEISLSTPREVELSDSGGVRLAAEVSQIVERGRVAFTVDGEPLAEDAASPYAAEWRPEEPGEYELGAILRDTSGRELASDTIRVTVREAEAPPPEVSFTSPQDRSVFGPGQPVPVSAVVESPLEIEHAVVTANGREIWAGSGPEISFLWTPREPGYHTLQASATDERGQTGESGALGVRIPVPAPEEPAADAGDAVASHYALIGARDFAGAYSHFSPDFRQRVPREGWIRSQRSYAIRSSTINSLEVESVEGDVAVVTVDVSFTDRTGTPRFLITWRLVRDGERWLLDEQLSAERLQGI